MLTAAPLPQIEFTVHAGLVYWNYVLTAAPSPPHHHIPNDNEVIVSGISTDQPLRRVLVRSQLYAHPETPVTAEDFARVMCISDQTIRQLGVQTWSLGGSRTRYAYFSVWLAALSASAGDSHPPSRPRSQANQAFDPPPPIGGYRPSTRR